MSPGSAEALPGDTDLVAMDDAGALGALVRHRGWWPAVVLGPWRRAVAITVALRAPVRNAGASVAPMCRCRWPPAVATMLWWQRRGAAGSGARAPIRRHALLHDVMAFPSAEGGWGVSGTPGSLWSPRVITLWWQHRAGGSARAPIQRHALLRDIVAFPSPEGGWQPMPSPFLMRCRHFTTINH
jgi:hypothetical protein